MAEPVPVSLIVLTKNEGLYIERCLASASFASEAIVVDSGSTDDTRERAAAAGAVIVEQEWLGWSRQRNRGIEVARHDWVLFLDADEILTAELARAIQAVLAGPLAAADGFSFERRSDFLGRLMPNEARRSKRRGFVRLFNGTRSRYDETQLVHEEVMVPGTIHPLDGVLLHWRGMTLDEIAATINSYGTIEAEMRDSSGERATALKIVSRPVLRFLWCYVRKGAWRHGTQGLMWSLMKATGEYYRYGKLWERQHRPEREIDPPAGVY